MDWNGSLSGWWNFEDSNVLSNGTVYDNSTWENTGTFVNSSSNVTSPGIRGRGLHFNGSSYVNVPGAQSLNVTGGITIEAWVNSSYMHVTASEALGTSGNPALSCSQILYNDPSATDGTYWLDPDGSGGNGAFTAFCDMSGGGWTLVAWKFSTSQITPQTLHAHSYSLVNYSSDPSTTTIFSAWDYVNVTDIRVVDTSYGYDYSMTYGSNKTMRDIMGVTCYASSVDVTKQIASGLYLKVCHSFYEGGPDGEGMILGYSKIYTCSADYCQTSNWSYANSYSSFDTKATYITSDSYHYNYGSVKVFVRSANVTYQSLGGMEKGNSYGLMFNNNTVVAKINSDTSSRTDTAPGWNHVAMTYSNSSGLKIYVNGNMTLQAGGSGVISSCASNLTIGRNFNGSLDEVRIYSRVLSGSEINASYNASFNGYYNNFTDLDEGSYTYRAYAIDDAGNINATEERTVTILADVNECRKLNTTNAVYALTQDVSSTGDCFEITADNVTLDGKGHSIAYGDQDSTSTFYGVYSDHDHTTIKNLTVHRGESSPGFQTRYGIFFAYNSYGVIEDINASFNYDGVHLESSSGNNLTNITSNSNDLVGVYLQLCSDNNLTNITANSNNYGVDLIGSSNNILTNVTADSNENSGVELRYYSASSSGNTLANSTITNSQYGVHVESTSGNTLTNITLNSNNYGLYLSSNSRIQIFNSNLSDNNYSDVGLSVTYDAGCGNVFENVTVSGNREFGYYNQSVTLEDKEFSELILCNADYSNLTNITVHGSDSIKNNALYIIRTEHSNFTSITSNNNMQGISLSSSSNNALTNITSNSNSFYGVYLVSASSNNFTNITANSNSQYGFYLMSASSNNFTNITANSNSQHGINLRACLNNIFYVVETQNCSSGGTYSCVYLYQRSNSNTFEDVYINHTGGTGNGILLMSESSSLTVSNNVFQDVLIENISGNDVYVKRTSSGQLLNNTFINASYNLSKEVFSGCSASKCQLIRKWHYQSYATDSSGNPISGANILAYNASSALQANLTTNGSGLTNKTTLTEYINNCGTRSYSNNYAFNASAAGYQNSSHGYNLSSANNLYDVFTLEDLAPVDNKAPAAAITSPAGGSVLSGVVSIEADASDESGISKVDFYYYGPALSYVLAGSDSVAPYSINWNSSGAVDGTYYLFVEAFDVYGNKKTTEGVSGRVYVTVKNVQASTTTTVFNASTTTTTETNTSTTSTSSSTAMSTTTTTTTSATTTTPQVPSISNLRVVSVSTGSAAIAWETDVECVFDVHYGENGGYGRSQNGSGYTYNHSITLSGLTENTAYSYMVHVVSRDGAEASGYGAFTTAYMYIAPVQLNTSLNDTIIINVSAASTIIEMTASESIDNGSLNITYSTSSPVNATLSVPELGRYVIVEASPGVVESLKSIILKLYYTDEELEDENLNESSLAMYWYNESAGSWIKLSTGLGWVYGTGVNMEQNYVWANVSHFSDYAVGGDNICPLKGDHPACGVVTLREVVNYILRWANGRAQLQDVINLIDTWSVSDMLPKGISYPIDPGVYTTLERTVIPVGVPSTSPALLPYQVSNFSQYGYGVWQAGAGLGFEKRLDLMPSDYNDTPVTNTASLMNFFTMSDVHITDKESPGQAIYYGYKWDIISGYSPAMIYTTHILDAAVQTVNALHKEKPFDFGISLGDDCNSAQYNELRWFIDVLDGKDVTPDSGIKDDPIPGAHNDYQDEYTAAGLDKTIPWYQTLGNHDHFWMGMYVPDDYIKDTLTGTTILNQGNVFAPNSTGIKSRGYYMGVIDGRTPYGDVIGAGPVGNYSEGAPTVPADPNRRFLSREEWISEFFNTSSTPVGHGFNQTDAENGFACYSFEPNASLPIKVIVLDDTQRDDDPNGSHYGHGSIDLERYNWLVSELDMGQAEGKLMIIAAHIPIGFKVDSSGLGSLMAWSTYAAVNDTDLIAKLHTYPNLILWIAGHRHGNTVTALKSPDPGRPELGFWEVETPSLREYPQQLRTIQIVRNSDNTVSILTADVDPAVRNGSLAALSRSYAVAAQQIFNTTIDPLPSGSYNAELVKQLSPEMQDKIKNYGTPI
jgi:metallophosphoesterase (TIGR03768 family)